MYTSNVIVPSAVEAIGRTPLVELSRITRGLGGRLLAKIEYLNPGNNVTAIILAWHQVSVSSTDNSPATPHALERRLRDIPFAPPNKISRDDRRVI